jgi:hypothetical protein
MLFMASVGRGEGEVGQARSQQEGLPRGGGAGQYPPTIWTPSSDTPQKAGAPTTQYDGPYPIEIICMLWFPLRLLLSRCQGGGGGGGAGRRVRELGPTK